MKKTTIKLLTAAGIIIALLLIAVLVVPVIKSFYNTEGLKIFIENLGPFGILAIFALQILQIVVAFIPGEVVEFVSGALYGFLGGTLICVLGIIAGEYIIFKAVKRFGKGFAEKITGSKKLEKFKFLQNERKLKRLTFVLFFLPGTPKDILTYVMPLTKIKMEDFLVISVFARFVSVVTSTIAGASFVQKDYLILLIIYLAVGALSILGVLLWKKMEVFYVRKHKNNSK